MPSIFRRKSIPEDSGIGVDTAGVIVQSADETSGVGTSDISRHSDTFDGPLVCINADASGTSSVTAHLPSNQHTSLVDAMYTRADDLAAAVEIAAASIVPSEAEHATIMESYQSALSKVESNFPAHSEFASITKRRRRRAGYLDTDLESSRGVPRVAALAEDFAIHRHQKKHESRGTQLSTSPWRPAGSARPLVPEQNHRPRMLQTPTKKNNDNSADDHIWHVAMKAAESAARRRQQSPRGGADQATAVPCGFGSATPRNTHDSSHRSTSRRRRLGAPRPSSASPPHAANVSEEWLSRRRGSDAPVRRETLAFGSCIPTYRSDAVPWCDAEEGEPEAEVDGDGGHREHRRSDSHDGSQHLEGAAQTTSLPRPPLDAAAIRNALAQSRARNAAMAEQLQTRIACICEAPLNETAHAHTDLQNLINAVSSTTRPGVFEPASIPVGPCGALTNKNSESDTEVSISQEPPKSSTSKNPPYAQNVRRQETGALANEPNRNELLAFVKKPENELQGMLRVKIMQARQLARAGYFEKMPHDMPVRIQCTVGDRLDRHIVQRDNPAILPILMADEIMTVEYAGQDAICKTDIHLRHVIASGQCKSWYDLCDTVDGTVPERRTMLQLEMSFSAQTKIVDTSKLSPKDSEFVPSESGPPIHVGRSELLEVVVRYCEEERPPPILLLSGPRGIGTSRLLQEFAEQYQHRQEQHSLVIFHQISAMSVDAWSVRKLLLSLCGELIQNYPAVLPVSLHGGVQKLTETWLMMTARVGNLAGKPVVYALDGLRFLRLSKWLPKTLPPSVRLIFALDDADFLCKSLISSEDSAELTVSHLSEAERRKLLHQLLSRQSFAGGINLETEEQLVNTVLSAEHASMPLYLVATCEVLCMLVNQGADRVSIVRFVARELPRTIVGVFRYALNFIEQQQSDVSVMPAAERSLSLLALASSERGGGGGLSRLELATLTKPFDSEELCQQLRPFICQSNGRLYFLHESLAAEVLSRYQKISGGDENCCELHRELGSFFVEEANRALGDSTSARVEVHTARSRKLDAERCASKALYHFGVSHEWTRVSHVMASLAQRLPGLGSSLSPILDELVDPADEAFAKLQEQYRETVGLREVV